MKRFPEQIDEPSRRPRGAPQHLKRMKNRAERRAAKKDPETAPAYGKYNGYLT